MVYIIRVSRWRFGRRKLVNDMGNILHKTLEAIEDAVLVVEQESKLTVLSVEENGAWRRLFVGQVEVEGV
jgi:hypothetical protein